MGKSILIVNGPNLNMLGKREPEIYGKTTLKDIENLCALQASKKDWSLEFMQSNHEGVMIDALQSALGKHDGVIINAAAYTHTSVALMDAIKAINLPCIEVHLSNIFTREEYRHKSYISTAATGVICGFGAKGYVLAMDALADNFDQQK
ncbi:MAG: type II 3-dehydroquinate dehydratase [Sneathiella sp.]